MVCLTRTSRYRSKRRSWLVPLLPTVLVFASRPSVVKDWDVHDPRHVVMRYLAVKAGHCFKGVFGCQVSRFHYGWGISDAWDSDYG